LGLQTLNHVVPNDGSPASAAQLIVSRYFIGLQKKSFNTFWNDGIPPSILTGLPGHDLE
jgi:hypothetical protein